MNTNNAYNTVKKYIDEYDFYDLLAIGATTDEYDVESKAISQNINRGSTIEEIALVISKVFSHYLGETDKVDVDNPDSFLELAKKIKNEL